MTTNGEEKRALVIGASGLDVVARVQGDWQPEMSNPALIRTSVGGVARNVAENLARLGQPACLLSVVGNDQAGAEVLSYTAQAGVDMSHVHRSERYPTGFYMAVLAENGQLRLALDDMRVLQELTDSYLAYHQDLFQESSLVFLDANLPAPAMQSVFDLAARFKIPICADPASLNLAPRLLPYLGKLDLICPNLREARALTGLEIDPADPDAALAAAHALVSKGVRIALITLGEFGLCYATSETSGHIPAIRTRIHDPVGAGDALAAAVVFAMLNDIDIDDAAQLGIAAASLTLRHEGTVMPDLSLEKLYDHLQA